jgi:hypothetical protein
VIQRTVICRARFSNRPPSRATSARAENGAPQFPSPLIGEPSPGGGCKPSPSALFVGFAQVRVARGCLAYEIRHSRPAHRLVYLFAEDNIPMELQYNTIWFALAIFTGIIAVVATAQALQSLVL